MKIPIKVLNCQGLMYILNHGIMKTMVYEI